MGSIPSVQLPDLRKDLPEIPLLNRRTLGMIAMQHAQCHLFVIPARDKPVAIIIRRGPSDWYHLIRWETRRRREDLFESGAWFRGRIFAERCDLSPDGNLFVYFAYQGNRFGTEYRDSYTAVSRSPWLHALALWPHGGTYGGGGRFLDNHTILGPAGDQHPDHRSKHIQAVPGSFGYHASTNEIPDADWSGPDSEGRLIYTRGGKLYRREQTGKNDVELADFRQLKPDPQPPPAWATRPS